MLYSEILRNKLFQTVEQYRTNYQTKNMWRNTDISNDLSSTIKEIDYDVVIRFGSAETNVINLLGLRKTSARTLSHLLTNENRIAVSQRRL